MIGTTTYYPGMMNSPTGAERPITETLLALNEVEQRLSYLRNALAEASPHAAARVVPYLASVDPVRAAEIVERNPAAAAAIAEANPMLAATIASLSPLAATRIAEVNPWIAAQITPIVAERNPVAAASIAAVNPYAVQSLQQINPVAAAHVASLTSKGISPWASVGFPTPFVGTPGFPGAQGMLGSLVPPGRVYGNSLPGREVPGFPGSLYGLSGRGILGVNPSPFGIFSPYMGDKSISPTPGGIGFGIPTLSPFSGVGTPGFF